MGRLGQQALAGFASLYCFRNGGDKSRFLLGCAKNNAKSKSRHKFFCPVWLQEQKPRQGNNFTKACLRGLLKSIAEYVLELLLVTETKKIDEIRYKKMRLYIF